ncbi:NAD(P)/FAD-dependent oxidoreductase [Microbacterium oryzae]|uniref:FAD-dependent oxidoreductase n=1 Tax=Microbacterium oryzae TaxID=743009 RepID=UPI0025B1632B|nr:NAD(P)/FAD-dependent oxidoreductase [Microbacterium oryzae]MDN3309768.1 NAD(P)/FAD-dependent oxidoreductase [Microbacterium oryzae]
MVQDTVIVVGAGPVGAVTALAAAQAGFRVELVEASAEIDTSPRAATFHPSTLEMLASLGIIDDFIRLGLVARYFDYWDKPARRLVARMDHSILAEETDFPFVVQTEQHKLANLVLSELAALPNATVRMGTRVRALEQDDEGVTVTVEGAAGEETLHGSWLVGADGGRSFVRKALDVEFEGYTWPERFLVLTTLHDFEVTLGCSYRSYFADPGGWTNLFKVAGDDYQGRWRAVFPVPEDESDEEALGDGSVARRLGPLLDGAPDQVVHRNLYRVHQRVAARFRVGRVFLAGDAAHVNNPIGGLGLNCGIHDAMELVESLQQADGANDDVLERYERRRRQLNIEFVQQQTIDNKRRLEETDPEVRAARLDELAAIAADPERMRAFLRRTSLLDSVAKSRATA